MLCVQTVGVAYKNGKLQPYREQSIQRHSEGPSVSATANGFALVSLSLAVEERTTVAKIVQYPLRFTLKPIVWARLSSNCPVATSNLAKLVVAQPPTVSSLVSCRIDGILSSTGLKIKLPLLGTVFSTSGFSKTFQLMDWQQLLNKCLPVKPILQLPKHRELQGGAAAADDLLDCAWNTTMQKWPCTYVVSAWSPCSSVRICAVLVAALCCAVLCLCLCCAVLCCAVLCCAVLCCACAVLCLCGAVPVLYCPVLRCACAVLCCAVPVLCCAVPVLCPCCAVPVLWGNCSSPQLCVHVRPTCHGAVVYCRCVCRRVAPARRHARCPVFTFLQASYWMTLHAPTCPCQFPPAHNRVTLMTRVCHAKHPWPPGQSSQPATA